MTTREHVRIKVRREVITRRRVELGLRSTELAEMAGIQPMAAWNAENIGSASPRTIRALAKALGLETNELFDVEIK